jgi:hypothetical protein
MIVSCVGFGNIPKNSLTQVRKTHRLSLGLYTTEPNAQQPLEKNHAGKTTDIPPRKRFSSTAISGPTVCPHASETEAK